MEASWFAGMAMQPGVAALTLGGAVLLAVVLGVALRRVSARLRTLRGQLLLITLAGVIVGALCAWQATTHMLLDAQLLGPVLVVLVITALVAAIIVLIASSSLSSAASRLARTVQAVEAGERDIRTEVVRRDEIGHVAAAIDALSLRLAELEAERERLDAERAVLLTSISHDLRSPLAALRAALESLVDGVAPDPDRYLRSMTADVETLTHLVDDAFLVATISGGRLHLQQEVLDLGDCCDTAIEALSPLADARQVTLALEVTDHVRVRGNAQALGRVLRNLIDNAVRHTPTGSTVTVQVGRPEPAAAPRVHVIDEGPGFPPDFLDRALEPWARADEARNRSTGGTGLGLAIAAGLVEAHGGRLWVEAGPGGRAGFTLPTPS
jgi:two-component system sensor histidine kinase BaeS